jgi:hypothetical protein
MRMRCDEEPMTFGEQLVIAVAPAAVAAIIEHIVAPLVGHAVAKVDAPKRRSKAKTRAALRGFASFVRFEKRRPA